MVKLHLKRLASPKTWPIPRKALTFIARPLPGPHSKDFQIPISVFLRDIIGIVQTQKEVKRVLHQKLCFIDGTVAHDNKRPVGLLDVVSIPSTKQFFRIGINTKNKLYPITIDEKESSFKISEVMKKTSLKGGKTQLNTFDGRNFLVDGNNQYSVGDSLVISLPEQKIIDHLPMKSGALIMLNAGRHVGTVGTVKEVEGTTVVVFADQSEFRTKRRYAIVIGKDKPIITL
jgi:small subunit ribosomal protein S4e